MKIQNILCTAILFFVCAFQGKSQTIHQWEVFPIQFEAKGEMNNPYIQIPVNNEEDLLVVKFRGISGDARGKELEFTGFWNGGNEWLVNFAPPVSGEWEYNSVSDDRNGWNIRKN
ncbi:MAG: DUF5060 domain-containing protein [Prolixibacteraceae bacterium]